MNSNNEKLTIKNEDFFFNFNIGVNKSDFFAKYEIDLEEIFEIWNPKSIIKIWYLKNFNITYNCELDVSRFLIGISKEENWALRMVDASGRHNSGIFSGNRYWLGAPEQCREMENNFLKWKKEGSISEKLVLPPFAISVFSISLTLEIIKSGINGTHNITLGLCLPMSCTEKDVKGLLNFSTSQREIKTRTIVVNNVRNLANGYVIWNDMVFYILIVAFIVASILVVLGTGYDLLLRHNAIKNEAKEQKRNNSNQNFYNDEITISKLLAVNKHNASLDVDNANSVPKPLSEALLAFSLLLNISKLCSFDVGSDTLAPIHGLRFISMLWIILVHSCLITNEISDSSLWRSNAEADFLYQTVSNGSYAVDTFFFISGCLVAFLYFRTITKEKIKKKKITHGFCGQIMQFLGLMGYRYVRLTPPYLLIIGLIQVSMKWYHDHTIIEFPTLDHETCEKFWWRNALYVNTYFNMNERCMVWSWYLANDTQFYTVGIIILIIAASFTSIGAAIGLFFLIASWITTAIITIKIEHAPSIENPFAHYESLYDKPWTRIGPYLIGMTTGWYLFRVNCKLQLNKLILIIGWTLAPLTMISIVYGLYGIMFEPILSAFYSALSHSGWALSIAWILISCVTENGGIVNKLLSWKYFYPISRLTYCVYLVHPAILRAIILQSETSLHLSHGLMAFMFFGVFISSYAASLFLSLFFEAPMVSLLRIVHPLRQWKRE
ncbi:nose resistant to fluoxetine protein 6-like [Leptopilina boulardi]|uniref:nose resistant to fluoxetine protein 6-like n=1 Tax=Leptopilina boulardi TaxID=63433 RepID=UPI0021F616BE|nr:nose resistant to fluoxetine protein 6-like [Leptopilina boulardi]